jgi:two-component system OmpR family response regulator
VATNPARVLVVDDEENVRFLVSSALQLAGFDTAHAETGRQALDLAESYRPDVVVLDVMLPDVDGFAIMERLRDRGSTAQVIFLTARDAVEDRVRGLTIGGADYQVKPFAVAELVARVSLRLQQAGSTVTSRSLRCADLDLDHEARRVTRADQVVHLTPTEYKLLHYLLVNCGRVLTRAQILEHVWAYDFEGDSSVVDTYVSYLRRKIDDVEPSSSTPSGAWASRFASSRDLARPAAARGVDDPRRGRPRRARSARVERSYLVGQIDRELRATRPLIDVPRPPVDDSIDDGDRREALESDPPFSHLFLAFVADDQLVPVLHGQLLDDTPDLDPEVLGELAGEDPFTTGGQAGSTRFRVQVVRSTTGSIWVAALPLDEVDSAVGRLRWALVGGTVVIGGVLLLATWWVQRLGLRPIARVTAAADAIARGDRSQRVVGAHPRTEAGRLAATFNVMLDPVGAGRRR